MYYAIHKCLANGPVGIENTPPVQLQVITTTSASEVVDES